jgi:hypothetical protein
MVVDGRFAGLEQSAHHLLAEVSAYNAPSQRTNGESGEGEEIRESRPLLDQFKDLVIPGKEVEFEQRLNRLLAKSRRVNNASDISLNDELQKLYGKIEEIAKAIPKTTTTPGRPI